MIQILKSGLRIIKQNNQLILVVVLIVIFPLLFIYTFQQFVNVAKANTNTVLQDKINMLQDTIEFAVSSNLIADPKVISSFLSDQEDLEKIRIVKQTGEDLIIIYDRDSSKIGTIEPNQQPFRASLLGNGETMIFNIKIEGKPVTQAFRYVNNEGSDDVYIFTQHDFSKINALLDGRILKSYIILSLIFLFIIALAYWIANQINYHKLYNTTLNKLKERDLIIDALVHEFRAPLTAIKGYASLLEESLQGEELTFATRVKESSTRLVTLVNDFLEAAHIQSGKTKIEIAEFNIVSITNKVISQMKPLADVKKLLLKTTQTSDKILLKTDTKRLEQVLINIINNAIKYTDQGEISVDINTNIVYTIFTIADTGKGISADDQKRMFTPFARFGTDEQINTVTGSGLGMWITKQIVEQLKGEISVESIKGVGTHVIIKFKNEID